MTQDELSGLFDADAIEHAREVLQERCDQLAIVSGWPTHLLLEAREYLQAGYRTGYRDGIEGRPYAREAGDHDLDYWHGNVEGTAALGRRPWRLVRQRRPGRHLRPDL